MSKITTGEMFAEWQDMNVKLDELRTAIGKVQDPAVKTALEAILLQLKSEMNVKVNNLPDIQKVQIENHQEPVKTVDIGNLPAIQTVKDPELIAAFERGGLVALDQNLVTGVGPIRIWTGTLNEYDAIANKDENIIYMVRG